MKILVVGSGGVGAAFAPIAARRDFFEHIVFADIDASRGQRVVDRYDGGTGRFSAAQVDATDSTQVADLVRASGADVVLNAADPRFVMPIFTGALDAGVDYLDMAMSLSEPHPEHPYERVGKKLGDEQFGMADLWEDRGKLALCGIGIEPGAADVFARYAADHLFSEIDEVGVRDGADSRDPRLRLRAYVQHLDHHRGVPQSAGDLGEGATGRGRGMVHDGAVLRARGVRLP